MKAKGELREFEVIGRKLPTEKEKVTPLYKMRIFAPDAIVAKSRFWYSSEIYKTPLKIKNFGIWLRYDSRSGTHNMYREYRDLSVSGAVTQCYRDMGARHRARAHSIQIIKVEQVKASNCRRPLVKQFHNSKIKFPLPKRIQQRMSEEEQDDFKARPYQEELMNIAKEKNTIIYLPTGSGKTFIAVMLIKEMSAGIEGGQRTFFMVNTVALVGQQAGYIQRHSRFAVGQYSGDMNVDYWTREKWKDELEKHQILVMTAQIFLNLLQHGYVNLSEVNLLIFDECHHAVNDQPMRQIMQKFEGCVPEFQPRVLGLTATLLNSNCRPGRVAAEVHGLETTFHSKVATCEDMADVCLREKLQTVEAYGLSKRRKEMLVETSGIRMVNTAIELVNSIAFDCDVLLVDVCPPNNARLLNENQSKTNKKLRNLLIDVLFHIEMLGMFGGSKACLAHIIQLERLRKKADDQQMKIVLSVLITTLTAMCLNISAKLFEDRMSNCSVEVQVRRYSSFKMLTLIEILSRYMTKEKEKFCTIVFVERRFTAKVLNLVLTALCKADEDLNHISPDFIVGFNNNPYNDTREGALEKKWCLDCLKRFQTGQTNVLIASDVLEEGMDIQKCNLVVKFDLPKNYRSYVQSKGRARHKTSWYIIMIPNQDNNFERKYRDFQETEQTLQRLLVGRTLERRGPTEEDIAFELYEQLVPPYTTACSSVSLASAIPLLNRYCSVLPQDLFTQLIPVWYIVTGANPSVCLYLPIASPLNDYIKGPEMPTKKLAKRAVALEACKRLHKIGELNDNLLPVGSKCEELDSAHLFPFFNNNNDNIEQVAPRGSKKRKQAYTKKFPEQLCKCRPKTDIAVFLHVIEMKPVYQKPDEENNRKLVFYNLLNSREGYAILCTKALPELCDFPIYMNVGEILIHVVQNASRVYLTYEQVEQLKSFNIMVFRKLLKLMKHFTIVDNEDKENSYFIVPTKKVFQCLEL
ncbi:hypothetical protein L9F63_010006, partial [Diploptera punctata]